MEESELEKLKKILRILKVLDYTEDDVQRVLKISKEDFKKIAKYFDVI